MDGPTGSNAEVAKVRALLDTKNAAPVTPAPAFNSQNKSYAQAVASRGTKHVAPISPTPVVNPMLNTLDFDPVGVDPSLTESEPNVARDRASPGTKNAAPIAHTPADNSQDKSYAQAVASPGTKYAAPIAPTPADPRTPLTRDRMHKNGSNVANDTLDLHTYRSETAVETVKKFLEMKMHSFRSVFIVTGQGNNSSNGPVIKPQVEEYLKDNGYSYYWENPGKVEVFYPLQT